MALRKDAKTLIKNRATLGGSPAEIVKYVNEQLSAGNEAELFVTVYVAILELSTGKGVVVNAGHEHPALMRNGEDFKLLKYRHCMALAIDPEAEYETREFELHPGDSLFVYTDGVPESTNKDDEPFGEERMLAALNAHKDKDVEGILNGVSESINDFMGDLPQFDDITMLVLKYYGPKAD